MKTKTLQELGVPTFHPEELNWRRSYLAEVESKELIGRKFKTKRNKVFVCKKITKEFVYFHNIEMERKHAYFLLPVSKQLTSKEQIEFIKNKYKGSTFIIGKGCQLHGDINGILTLKDGTQYRIPWNY